MKYVTPKILKDASYYRIQARAVSDTIYHDCFEREEYRDFAERHLEIYENSIALLLWGLNNTHIERNTKGQVFVTKFSSVQNKAIQSDWHDTIIEALADLFERME